MSNRLLRHRERGNVDASIDAIVIQDAIDREFIDACPPLTPHVTAAPLAR